MSFVSILLFLTTTFILPVNMPLSVSKLKLFIFTCILEEITFVMLFLIKVGVQFRCDPGAHIFQRQTRVDDGEPVVLSHGWPDTHVVWREQIPVLEIRP